MTKVMGTLRFTVNIIIIISAFKFLLSDLMLQQRELCDRMRATRKGDLQTGEHKYRGFHIGRRGNS